MKRRAPSEQGLEAAERHVDLFVRALMNDASRIAGRRGADEASATHIDLAAAHLYSTGASRTNQALSVVGSLIAGVAGSALVSILLSEPVNALGVGLSVLVLLASSVVTAVGLLRGS